MAESVSNQLLSAVTEGQSNSNSNLVILTTRRNRNRPNFYKEEEEEQFEKRYKPRKRSSSNLNSNKDNKSPIKEKRRRNNSGNKDCIAARTRSKDKQLKSESNQLINLSVNRKSSIVAETSSKKNIPKEENQQQQQQRKLKSKKQQKQSFIPKIIKKEKIETEEEEEEANDEEEIIIKPSTSRKLRSSDRLSTTTIVKPSTSLGAIPKKRLKISDLNKEINTNFSSKTPNLGARLARNREPQHSTQDTQGQPPTNLLRRSSRPKSSQQTATTGSCVSSTGSTSRASTRNQTIGSTNKTTKNQSSGSQTAGLQFEIGGPSTSQAAMASDGSRSTDTNSTNNPTIKLHRSSILQSSVSIDVNNAGLLGQQGASGGATSSSTMASNSSATATNPDSESDDNEVGRLQALLEARGLPPHLFGALGPRMHHLLHRTMGASSSSKAQQLLQGLQAPDESQQLQASIEMCQMLVMGNEDTLAGFPIKQVVPALITLLRMEHNFDIMNHACRALAYMLEALPRSSLTVIDAIPVFLEKLQVIQCMDVAEQSLTALEILSRRHNKAILQANGVSACLTYLDFFSINAQRAALAITANCCLNLHSEEFHFVTDSLSNLARLLAQQDKKCVESVCSAFYRLVDSFQHDAPKLQEIASMDLLKNCQQLLVLTPSILNSGTFTNVVRMLSVMCANCPDLAITLLKNDIASTLLYLLTGSADSICNNADVELVSRSPSELYEITCLIGELMPRLPTDGIFIVDALLDRPQSGQQDQVQWQWRDDRAIWHSYSAIDSRMIEAAHLNSDDELSLMTLGRTYTVDFHSMQQINEDTGTTRPVQRKLNPITPNFEQSQQNDLNNGNEIVGTINLTMRTSNPYRDARIACLKEERGLAAEFIKNLFSVLYEVYTSSAGPAVRYKCLRALLRMVYFANSDLLRDVLKNQIVSSHIAGMMASNDLRIIVGAIQMAEILMEKLPEVFSVNFRREGVFHQIALLADPTIPICVVNNPSPKSTTSAPASASSVTNQTAFDFDTAGASTSKGTTNLKNYSSFRIITPKSLSMPSTSATAALQSSSLPSTSSNILAKFIGDGQQPPNNGNLLYNAMYNQTAMPMTSGRFKTEIINLNEGTTSSTTERSSSPGQNKMSDILKRKVPPKRKSQSSGRVKTRQDDTNAAAAAAAAQSSVMQELISKATTIGSTSGRNTPSSSVSRSRFSGTSKTSSFLASLNPARWGRQTAQTAFPKDASASNLNKSPSNSNLIAAGNREKARQWIRDQAISFMARYSEQEIIGGEPHPATSILSRLTCVIQKLEGSADDCVSALKELHDILIESDISPFEVNHSGLIKAMLNFMAVRSGLVKRDDRLRAFLHIFAGLPLEANCGRSVKFNPNSFFAFVTKLNGCVTQLEQFPVKVHDFPAGVGGRSNTSALKFFNTHQLKCNLQRHPECTNLRQWKGGTVKIDPLALVQAIERYLVVRGYGGIRVDSEEDSEEDIDDTVAAVVMSQSGFKHKLQFLIGENILPYNMTVYQAVKQFSSMVNDQSETDTDSETPIGSASVWVQQHTIYYRPIEDDPSNTSNSSGGAGGGVATKGGSTNASAKRASAKIVRRKADLWVGGIIPTTQSPFDEFLTTVLPADVVTVQDASLDALSMLRIVNALNRHWNTLYDSVPPALLIPQSEFIHSKIAAKANRQLQDPLVIMTGNLPQWLQQIATVCPFLFPFETRHLLFYAVSFDRDRALQRLLDTAPDLNSADTSERVTPRLDRRKRAISREDILKQAEHIIQDFGHSKALLEIQYENEVGTGLGPTLEFYALVSTELQRTDLNLWNDSDSYNKQTSSCISDVVKNSLNNIEDVEQTTGVGGGIVADLPIGGGVLDVITNDGSPLNNINLLIEQNDNNSSFMVVNNQNSEQIGLVFNNTLNSVSDNSVESDINDVVGQISTNNQQPPSGTVTTYVTTPNGLFPSPLGKSAKLSQISRIKTKFRFLGKFMAKAVMDSRMLDLPFSTTFYRWLLNEENSLSISDLAEIAPEVQATLLRLQDIVIKRDAIQSDTTLDVIEKTEKIEALDLDGCLICDLELDFILPGHSNIEIKKGGRDIGVTINNLHQYISLVTHWFLNEGVNRQFEALREGFDSVFPVNRLKMFYPEELESVFCGSGTTTFQRWEIRMLQESCRTDHGFTQDSKAIQFFYDILSMYTNDEQRLFLQFVTGSPRLPIGGFKSLTPPLTIVRKTMDNNQNPDLYLPSVMTCVNYLKLPEYSSREVMKTKLKMAASEGSMCFHLS